MHTLWNEILLLLLVLRLFLSMHAFGSFSDAYAYALERNLAAAAAGVAIFF